MRSRLSRGATASTVSACRCESFAPGRLSSRRGPSPAFLAVLAPLLPRLSGGCTCGVHRWIWLREWRRASPYLLPHPPDPAPALWDRKPALRFLPPGERARCSACLPPRRLMWWASMRIRPLNRPSMRSCGGGYSHCGQVEYWVAHGETGRAAEKQIRLMLSAEQAATSTPGPAFFPRPPHRGVEVVGSTILICVSVPPKVGPVRYERKGQGLPHGRPACAFWQVPGGS